MRFTLPENSGSMVSEAYELLASLFTCDEGVDFLGKKDSRPKPWHGRRACNTNDPI